MATLTTILGDIASVVAAILTVFADMIDAVTSNPWLLVSILMGFSGTIFGIAFRVIRKARRL